MGEAAECGRVAVWAAGLCALALGSVLLGAFPRNREGVGIGLAGGIALGMFVGVAWQVWTACRVW
ncbi:MAG: hypothetical protein OXF93_24285 [Acidobacteria bacterium]|nr:hypothetical protein [Acidobacteriota bacterium]